MINCYIKFFNNTLPIFFNFNDLSIQDYENVQKLVFHKLKSFELEIFAPQVYKLINLEVLETADRHNKIEYSEKLANLIHLNLFTHYPISISKCFQHDNKAIIINYNLNIIIPQTIEYINIFINYIDYGINENKDLSKNSNVYLLNNLHNGIKYLQINIVDFAILKYINNLPVSLETFNVNILKSVINMLWYSIEDYLNYAHMELNKIKIPFNCKTYLKFCDF